MVGALGQAPLDPGERGGESRTCAERVATWLARFVVFPHVSAAPKNSIASLQTAFPQVTTRVVLVGDTGFEPVHDLMNETGSDLRLYRSDLQFHRTVSTDTSGHEHPEIDSDLPRIFHEQRFHGCEAVCRQVR